MGIIVVADTHFGIKKADINMSMPGHFAEFLEWIKSLEDTPTTVNILKGSLKDKTITKKTITHPEKIIFLGDIIELWDSENEPVNACVTSTMPTLSEINSEKIYVLGNHDNILKRIVLKTPHGEYMNYCLGRSVLKVFPSVYPPVSNNTLIPEKYGDEEYIFVHGHQFDKYFTESGGSYKIWSIFRNVSNNLTLYVPFLFLVSAITRIINWGFGTSCFFGKNPVFGLLLLLSIPRILVDYARRFWDLIVGMRYQKRETIANFVKWWKKFTNNLTLPENINVVYGHTHFLNYIPSPKQEKTLHKTLLHGHLHALYKKELAHRKIPEKDRPALLNISSWITDFQVLSEKFFSSVEKAAATANFFAEKKKNKLNPNLITVGTFLYIDEEGAEYFGWNWYTDSHQKIFHIPKAGIIQRRDHGPVADDPKVKKILEELGWPQHVIEIWEEDPHME
ncbi:MAG: hypothetical protein PVF58_14835 [Candidatus Methanofastidiosia archaeon]|jgi:UDP-2,3-diacylglucosamine pyrophosphatase LpxH